MTFLNGATKAGQLNGKKLELKLISEFLAVALTGRKKDPKVGQDGET